ncbi:MAG: DUF2493 domain-containing protein [bacterium]|nr:DUF2493 domain-containing protein [bacterium]
MRVIVCGGRDYPHDGTVARLLNAIADVREIREVVHGGARGVDEQAGGWAYTCTDHGERVYTAQWVKHGKAAGPIRNSEMAKAGADLCIAFPGGRGTADMVSKARTAGIPVLDLRAERRR